MTITGYTIAVILILVGIILWYYHARKGFTKASNHAADHKVIKESIATVDGKVIDLEIRVRVLEDK